MSTGPKKSALTSLWGIALTGGHWFSFHLQCEVWHTVLERSRQTPWGQMLAWTGLIVYPAFVGSIPTLPEGLACSLWGALPGIRKTEIYGAGKWPSSQAATVVTSQQSHATLNALVPFHWYTSPLDYGPGGDHSCQQ